VALRGIEYAMNSLSAGVDQPAPSRASRARTGRRREPGAPEFYLLAVMLVYAPLFQAGNRPLPLLGLELMALGLAGLLVWRPAFLASLSKLLVAALGILLLWPLLQLLPLPENLWSLLPGRSFYAQALGQIDGGPPFAGLRAGSIVPFATEGTWLAMLPAVLVFLAAMGLPAGRLQALTALFLGIAVAQAVLGLIQYGDGPDSMFRLGNPYYTDSAVGTYVNRNHLAGLLEMALPVTLALLAAMVGVGRRRYQGRRPSLRRRLAALAELGINRAMLSGAGALAILLGLVFTRSRTGIALGMLGILLSVGAFSWRLGGRNVYGLVGSFTAVGVGLATLIGLAPVVARFANQDPAEDARWSFFADTGEAIRGFFPLGSGGGTFEEVFHRFDSGAVLGRLVDHAHNDYLEWVVEYGLPAALVLILLLGVYLRQWRRVWARGTWSTFRFVQAGAGIALLLMALHTVVDFNLHIPANAVFFAFLAGVFCHPPQQEESGEGQVKRRRIEEGPAEVRPPGPATGEIPPENRINPFLQ